MMSPGIMESNKFTNIPSDSCCWRQISEFVQRKHGNRPIQRVLIANNGIAAVKEIRSVRRWSYSTFGDERAVKFIAMATPEDISANAEYIRMADEYASVPGGPNNMNYANVKLIIELAEQTGAQAVWAGWGHASENPRLPEGLKKLGIAFIGPPAQAMQSLGDKISSMIIAQTANVPCLPWSGTGLTLDLASSGIISELPQDLYRQACVTSAEEGIAAAEKIGFPLMIKASEGGGGKGIRSVQDASEFAVNFDFVQREVPGSPIFLMKLASEARHLEVQLLADEHGQAISIFGRDCSVQRRHQKIIEEAPVTCVSDPEQWKTMEQAAVRLAKLVGYVSTGTVEFLYDVAHNEVSFLELNPRLQVEHPCTEMISRVNLPAAQLQVAMGIPLNQISDIRKLYGRSAEDEDSFIDFTTEQQVTPFGHVIACRITAENPEAGFKPGGGKMSELTFRSSSDVWGYFSIPSSGNVHEYADSQFGHVFAWGLSRNEARNNMVLALKEATIRGEFRTTIEYIVKLLETETFRKCTQTTAWLDGLIKKGFGSQELDVETVVACGAAWQASNIFAKRSDDAKILLQKGQLPPSELLERTANIQFVFGRVQYKLKVLQTGPDRLSMEMNGTWFQTRYIKLADGGILVSLDEGKSCLMYGKDEPQGLRLTINNKTAIIENENDPTVVRSPSTGKLVRYLVAEGSVVPAGTAIAEIEVMKMYMPLVVTEAGAIHPKKASGSGLEAGEIVARIVLLDPSNVKKTTACVDGFSSCKNPIPLGNKPHHLFMEHLSILENCILMGYNMETSDSRDLISRFIANISNPQLPLYFLSEKMSNIMSRIPASLNSEISDWIKKGFKDSILIVEALRRCTELLVTYFSTCDMRDAPAVKEVIECIKPHLEGSRSFAEGILANMCDQYYSQAVIFDGAHTGDAIIHRLKESYTNDYDKFLVLVFSWSDSESRQFILGNLLKTAVSTLYGASGISKQLTESLRRLTKLTDKHYSRISHASREALLHSQLPSIMELRRDMENKFRQPHEGNGRETFITNMVSGMAHHMDVLPSFFLHEDKKVRHLAAEIYIKRVYEAFPFIESGMKDDMFSWVVAAPSLTGGDKNLDDFGSPAVVPLDKHERRAGCFLAFDSAETALAGFDELVCTLSPTAGTKNIVYFALPDYGQSDNQVLERWVAFMKSKTEMLSARQIRRVTMILVRQNSTAMGYFTFRDILDWNEDCQVRFMEPAMSYLLELPRILHNYSVKLFHADPTGQIHIYKGDSEDGPSRLFARVLIRPMQTMKGHNTLFSLTRDGRSIFGEVLDSVAMVQSTLKKPLDCNHLYIYVLPTFYAEPSAAAEMFLGLMRANTEKLLKLRLMEGEIRMNLASKRGEAPQRYRFFLYNETGFVNRVKIYKEMHLKPSKPAQLIPLSSEGKDINENEYISATSPYPLLNELQVKRNRVHALETSYVYDFPIIFQRAVELAWNNVNKIAPPESFVAKELVMGKDGRLEEADRKIGINDIGMVAWRICLKTPHHPEGRTIVVIANDIDFEIGSFGVAEDRLFAAASELARKNSWPRIFLSANSGARIGLAEEVKSLIKAKWIDETDPAKGFEYLFLTPEVYKTVKTLVCGEYVSEFNHYRLTDVLAGQGVENLSGSALIASETSRAYTDSFTLTIVTGRSVGIGAYLVRLGQRVIQKQVQPIILTGVNALNQLLGREVYSSNLQIGGPQIMAANGVSHLVVSSDLEAVLSAITWLDFVPSKNDSTLPLCPVKASLCADEAERSVNYTPPAAVAHSDPRLLVTGADTDEGIFLGGLLDRGSFVEYQSMWAKSVVVGRGRLGGMAVAVLLVETRTTQAVIPADPATPTSESVSTSQAGQVWYPDSAYKTAQFLRDCSNGEGLPLLILANWRGFSGGQRDLFEEILKYGSYIVDALREYRAPVFVYIPPNGQLRGGSWVVVDTAISPRRIEMYADGSARGGIIEPEGLVAIKFRGPQLKKMLERLLPGSMGGQDKLVATMHQIACKFADLHDCPGRMKTLGIIKDIVQWKDSRRFFYHRLRVRLWHMQLLRRAAYLCGVLESDRDGFDGLYDEIILILNGEWLPSLCIDPLNSKDSEISDAMDRHCGVLENKLQEYCKDRLANSISNTLDKLMTEGEKAVLLQKLLSECTRGKSPFPSR